MSMQPPTVDETLAAMAAIGAYHRELHGGDLNAERMAEAMGELMDALRRLGGVMTAPPGSDQDALDRINLLLSAPEWPGASGMEDVCDIVRATGRVEVEDAPDWPRQVSPAGIQPTDLHRL
jgi:hypothetical protein